MLEFIVAINAVIAVGYLGLVVLILSPPDDINPPI
jgi:hypothetical protein